MHETCLDPSSYKKVYRKLWDSWENLHTGSETKPRKYDYLYSSDSSTAVKRTRLRRCMLKCLGLKCHQVCSLLPPGSVGGTHTHGECRKASTTVTQQLVRTTTLFSTCISVTSIFHFKKLERHITWLKKALFRIFSHLIIKIHITLM